MTLMNHELTFIQNELKKELDEPRYQHTLGVMYTASAMAMCHGADLAQALTVDFYMTVPNVFLLMRRYVCVKNMRFQLQI